MYKTISKCRICGNKQLESILTLGEQALTGVFPRSLAEEVTKGPVELVKCVGVDTCGLVQLKQSYDHAEMYGMNYGYRSGLNASMVNHLHSKVRKIVSAKLLEPGDIVIDVGSNDATTLRAYPQDTYELVGIDPTGVKFAEYYPKAIRLIPDFFSAATVNSALAGRKAKVITSFSMFYDLEDPVSFAKEVTAALADEGVWIFEQSYLPAMLRTSSFDTICHEHLEFYALKQIMWIAKSAGLKILDVEFNDVNGGSFSITASKTSSSRLPKGSWIDSILADEKSLGLDGLEVYAAFRNNMQLVREKLVAFLQDAKTDGKVVLGLGASTKGNVLLQYCGITAALLPLIGEANQDKFGAYTPGTRIPLVAEDEVLALKPDYLLVLPWHFRSFFLASPKMRGKKLVFPLPTFEIVQC